MCNDRDDIQWTGMHTTMDQLVCLGVALDLVEITPRDMNAFLPGGVPYVMYKDAKYVEQQAQAAG
jgi:hypothetical protein